MNIKLKFNNSSEGFTIIEILIVLAVAAIILLVIFLAVPGLQRNQKNNSTKADAGRLVSALSTFEVNNNYSAPGFEAGATFYLNIGSDMTSIYNEANIKSVSPLYNSNITTYCGSGCSASLFNNSTILPVGSVHVVAPTYFSGGSGNLPTAPTGNTLVMLIGYACPSVLGANPTPVVATQSSIAVFFTTLTSSIGQWNCLQAAY